MQPKQTRTAEAVITSLLQKSKNYWKIATENPAAPDPDKMHPSDLIGMIILCVILGVTISL